jgi:hypothetical protein
MNLESRFDFRLRAAATLGLIGVLLIGVAFWKQRTTTQGLLAKQRSANEWAFYNSKTIRRLQLQSGADLLQVMKPKSPDELAAYANEVKKYELEAKEIQEQAVQYDREASLMEHRLTRLALAAVLLEFAIVVCALAIAAQREGFLHIGLLIALVASALGISTFLMSA